MKVPQCQGSGVLHPPREMRLTSETEKFWTFTCGCGCIRAMSKPSVRAQAVQEKTQRQIDQLRALGSVPRRTYSFGSK